MQLLTTVREKYDLEYVYLRALNDTADYEEVYDEIDVLDNSGGSRVSTRVNRSASAFAISVSMSDDGKNKNIKEEEEEKSIIVMELEIVVKIIGSFLFIPLVNARNKGIRKKRPI